MLLAVTALRWFIDRGASGAPFALYYPLVIVTAVALGGKWAIAACLLSGGLSVFLFFQPAFTLRAESPDLVILALYAFGCLLIAYFGDALRAALQEADEHAAALGGVNRELHHRSRNIATVVRALLHRARKSSANAESFDQLEAQLTALFAANEMLRFGLSDSCDLKALVIAVLKPFPGHQFRISGPVRTIDEGTVTRLAMILHELATNAVKHGALSRDDGQVTLEWKCTGHGSDKLTLTWSESGGPTVNTPTRQGLGSYLLRPGGGLKAAYPNYGPEGFSCQLVFDEVTGSGRDVSATSPHPRAVS
jgi:two-component sensor histidine kinase